MILDRRMQHEGMKTDVTHVTPELMHYIFPRYQRLHYITLETFSFSVTSTVARSLAPHLLGDCTILVDQFAVSWDADDRTRANG